ncbi:heme o synthase [Aurantimicrobium minutum]|uniref:heme o synthase n=1 Tax=Aurantimicrobium minutum TaxID=708131 RepID=UPI0024749638|nr:heme o synthase [Aurantimicrobium minutum]MDH6422466.1 protoheme IX farnesyltransferase [Aurantimicrobium minutum]
MNASESGTPAVSKVGIKRKVSAYVSLTKPRVMELLLAVTIPTMFLAQEGIPNLWLVLVVLLGGMMSAGSAGTFNCYIDRDIDRLMNRTKGRPLVTGEISDREALVFAWVLAIISTLWFLLFTNVLAASLSVSAIAFYVIIYSLVLKRRTPQNIVWGGAAGGFPVLIGWAAVTGSLTWTPVVLFLIIFLWTPPHYWPLSWRYRDDYKNANVPMLTVVRGRVTVGLQIVLYAWATFAATLLLVPIGHMGWTYTAIALVSGIWFVAESHMLYSRALRHEDPKPMRLFHFSNGYLSLIFLAVAIDALLPF